MRIEAEQPKSWLFAYALAKTLDSDKLPTKLFRVIGTRVARHSMEQ